MKNVVDKRVAELFGDLMPADHEYKIETAGSANRSAIIVDDNEFDIVKIMNESTDPDTGLLRDLRIDDRDLYAAKNFYDFSLVMLKEDMKPPWMMQMWTGLMLFGEVCPCCSDKRWMNLEWLIENVDRATPAKEIKQGMKLLRHGVCPKCKRTKGDLYMNYGLRNYTELVNCLGQRSGKSSSASFYLAYLLHRWLKFPHLASLSSSMQKSTEITGTIVGLTASRATTIWTPFTNIIQDARWFCLTGDSLVSTPFGQRRLDDIQVGDQITTDNGVEVVTNTFNNGVKECVQLELDSGHSVIGTTDHKVQCLGDDGCSLVWRRIGELTEFDLVVVE